jgi:hypothetical protein
LKTFALLITIRYPTRFIPFAFFSMALFHFPLWLNRQIFFYKLMGSGKNGTFDIHPDFNQWAIMAFWKNEKQLVEKELKEHFEKLMGKFIIGWLKMFRTQICIYHLEPYSGHGSWDGEKFIDQSIRKSDPEGRMGVLTRATIRLNRLYHFWKAVPGTSEKMNENKGFVYSIGIGEIPFVKQATFSIWESAEEMKNFAYKKAAHREVIKKTRSQQWYSEEMFLRFYILDITPLEYHK